MIISRVKIGWFLISGSIILFGLPVILVDDPDPSLKVAMLTSIENFLFFLSLILMIIGIYFVVSSKSCPACGEKLAPSVPDCQYCGYVFKDAPAIDTGYAAIFRRFRSRLHH